MRKLSDPTSEIAWPELEQYHAEFLATRKEEMISLRSDLNNLNFQAILELTHKWKSFAAPYGFQELERLAVRLEAKAMKAEAQGCEEILKEIGDYLGD